MFDGLTERLSGVFDRLGGRGVLSDKDIDEALREVRVALLEADVALPVVKDFISKAKELAVGRVRHPLGQAGRSGGQDRL
jgi:signal recognition particle subunit SRP54